MTLELAMEPDDNTVQIVATLHEIEAAQEAEDFDAAKAAATRLQDELRAGFRMRQGAEAA